MEPIRILLVDDQSLFVENLKVILELNDPSLQVVGIASHGKMALSMVRESPPHVILMDVRMPQMDGVEATKLIHHEFPHVKIMMLTTFDDDIYVHRALNNGAAGYVLKNISSENLIQSIKSLNLGQGQISPSLITKLVSPNREIDHVYDLDILSSRERDVLFLLSRGYDNQEISEKLFIAHQTVKNHIGHIYEKLNIHHRMEAMKAAGDPRLKEWCLHLIDER